MTLVFEIARRGHWRILCFFLSLIRLIHPRVLLPATTALGTIVADGREQGIFGGGQCGDAEYLAYGYEKKLFII